MSTKHNTVIPKAYVFPGPGSFPGLTTAGADAAERSRLCERIWLESSLFNANEQVITGSFEEFYPIISGILNRDLKAGAFGEQILFSGIDPASLKEGAILSIGDAKLKVVTAPDLSMRDRIAGMSPKEFLPKIPHCKLVIIEEGMVQPGESVTMEQ